MYKYDEEMITVQTASWTRAKLNGGEMFPRFSCVMPAFSAAAWNRVGLTVSLKSVVFQPR